MTVTTAAISNRSKRNTTIATMSATLMEGGPSLVVVGSEVSVVSGEVSMVG